ncbi:MAG: hypothetical protein JSV42_00560 [Chloroflexota bacterium]|nr:MAG: hypothetical protein JSV42_00560 [Chloroflexota bacterium]
MVTENSQRSENASIKKISVDQSAIYTIRVMGKLDKSWSERLSGMTILSYNTVHKDGMDVTTLTGKLQDQTELAGVLNTLYNLRLPLLSVEYLGFPEG